MAGYRQLDRSIGYKQWDQVARNKLNNGGSNVSGTVVVNNTNLVPYILYPRTFFLYSAAAPVKTLYGLSYEYNGIAHFADVTFSLDAPAALRLTFRKAQYQWGSGVTEKGRIEIVGLSTPGTPDYIITAEAEVPASNTYAPGKTNTYNGPLWLWWNDKYNSWDTLRPWGRVARGMRLRLIGRFILRRDNTGAPPTGGALITQWIDNSPGSTITDAGTPTGASDMQVDGHVLGAIPEQSDATWNNTGVATFLPTVSAFDVAAVTTVELAFPARYVCAKSEVHLETYSWAGANPGDRRYWTAGTRDQIDHLGAAAPNKFSFQLSADDFRAQTATVNTLVPNAAATVVFAANSPCTRGLLLRNLDELRCEADVSIEVIGDDLSAA